MSEIIKREREREIEIQNRFLFVFEYSSDAHTAIDTATKSNIRNEENGGY